MANKFIFVEVKGFISESSCFYGTVQYKKHKDDNWSNIRHISTKASGYLRADDSSFTNSQNSHIIQPCSFRTKNGYCAYNTSNIKGSEVCWKTGLVGRKDHMCFCQINLFPTLHAEMSLAWNTHLQGTWIEFLHFCKVITTWVPFTG